MKKTLLLLLSIVSQQTLFAQAPSAANGKIKVYFNLSTDKTVSTGENAITLDQSIDDTIIAYLNRAKHTIDIAIYSFDNKNISNISTAVNNASKRGVKVRIIADGSNNNPALSSINTAIPIVKSPLNMSPYGIMHNKFMIIDANSTNPNDPVLWTGATNWTDNQIKYDANDVIVFQDQAIAQGYKAEFDEMWGSTGDTPNKTNSQFGPFKTDNTPHEYTIGGVKVEVYFSPSDETEKQMIEKINSANTALCVAGMLITRYDFADKIVAISGAGVKTYILVDDTVSSTAWSIFSADIPSQRLASYDGNTSGIMHHKYILIDPNDAGSDPMVITGSHNFTTAANTKNDENTVIIHDATIANLYYQEFVKRFTTNGGEIDKPSGVNEFRISDFGFRIYPNPTDGKFTLQISDFGFAFSDLKVINMLGQIVYQSENANPKSEINFNLPQGMYFLQMNDGKTISTQKIVVQ